MLYKRGKYWWVRFTIRGREIRVTSGTDRKALAEEFERGLREQLWREIELGEVQHTWEEATERWLKEKAHKRSLERDREIFAIYEKSFRGEALHDLTAERIRDAIHAIGTDEGNPRQPGTQNRHLATIRSILNAAIKWGWLTSAPKVEAQHVDQHDPRFISQDQFASLAVELPPHLSRMARFAVATGLRWFNISGLKWAMVDLERSVAYVASGETKNRRAIAVPLSADAVRVLQERRREGARDRKSVV